MRQPIKDHGSPRRGTGFVSHTKILINRRFPRFSVKSPNIGGDLVGVDVSFRSFFCAKENGHT